MLVYGQQPRASYSKKQIKAKGKRRCVDCTGHTAPTPTFDLPLDTEHNILATIVSYFSICESVPLYFLNEQWKAVCLESLRGSTYARNLQEIDHTTFFDAMHGVRKPRRQQPSKTQSKNSNGHTKGKRKSQKSPVTRSESQDDDDLIQTWSSDDWEGMVRVCQETEYINVKMQFCGLISDSITDDEVLEEVCTVSAIYPLLFSLINSSQSELQVYI